MLHAVSINPLTPMLPVTCSDKPWPVFHFWCDHLWPKRGHYRCLTSVKRKDLSNDTQIRLIASMEPEICRKMKKLNEKLRAKFPVTSHGYSMIKITSFNEAFSEFFVARSKLIGRSLITAAKRKEKEKKERWRKK